MDYFPIFLRLAGEPALVVGGGEVAARKVELLLRAGAQVTVVAPELADSLSRKAAQGLVRHVQAEFQADHLDGARVAIAASNKRSLNAWVAHQAERRNIPVNVVDDRELSRFIMPAIIDRSPVIVAVGSSGDAPVLTRRLREKLETFLPQRLGALAALAGKFRSAVKSRLSNPLRRRRFWETFFDGEIAADLLAGRRQPDDSVLNERIEAALSAACYVQPSRRRNVEQGRGGGERKEVDDRDLGDVVLVGAGPGDPGLLTLRALRALQDADVILYDRLVSAEVLDLARRDAQRIYVGKTVGAAQISQQQINELLVSLAQQGRRVCRLKGGDPFIFGRGGEELQALAAAGVRFEVVPGVTAAAGCAAYAGIPLTHRDYAQSLTFVTGRLKAGEQAGDSDVDWAALARPGQTVVFYMGLGQLEHILQRLREQGAPSERAAAL